MRHYGRVLGLELVVVLGVAILLCSVAAQRLRITPPVLLLLAGALLGFIPSLRGVSLPPEAMLLLFLPALLYWESLTTSLREIRSNLRSIVLMSTVLVIATAASVAAVAHALGLPWGPAWVLGAAVAPTDATAVGVIARALPRRLVTSLRAESLVNDGTALVIYGLAVGVTVGEQHIGPGMVAWLSVLAYVGGATAGLATAWLVIQARRHLDNPFHENVVSLLTPFLAFLLAELINASGVLAVVVCGLTLSQVGPRIVRAETRQQSSAFWGLSTFLLNSALFVLIGLQAQAALRGLTTTIWTALGMVGLISATVMGTRFLWLFTTPYIVRTVDRRPQQRLRRVGARTRVVSAMAGFRGAVSLAAALAVPQTIASGEVFPARDTIIFVTSGVVVVTLVVQGLLLPIVVRWARMDPDTQVEEEHRLAQVTAAEEAFAALPELAAQLGTSGAVVERLQREYDKHLRKLQSDGSDVDGARLHQVYDQDAALRLAVIAHKRATVVRLRDEQRIDDTVLRQLQTSLDLEEVRLSGRQIAD
jgi:CPA1 family monovalent cation:H+ antiporter